MHKLESLQYVMRLLGLQQQTKQQYILRYFSISRVDNYNLLLFYAILQKPYPSVPCLQRGAKAIKRVAWPKSAYLQACLRVLNEKAWLFALRVR